MTALPDRCAGEESVAPPVDLRCSGVDPDTGAACAEPAQRGDDLCRYCAKDRETRERIAANSIPESNTGCWLWLLTVDRSGYGNMRMDGRSRGAHRISYEVHIGSVPDGMVLDHLCRVRSCVNPSHLEPVTNRENCLRGAVVKTHCLRGHPLSGENLRFRPERGRAYPARLCVTCVTERNRQSRERIRAAATEVGR